MKRPSARRSPSHNLAIVLAFTVSAVATACTGSPDDDDWGGGAAGTAAISGSGGTAGNNATGGATAGNNATGGATAGNTATGGTMAGTTATGGSGGVGPNATGGFSNGGSATGGRGITAGSGGKGGSAGSDAAGTGGRMSVGGSAGTAGSGGNAGAGGGEVPDEPYCAVTASWDPEYAALEDEIVVLVNQYRAEGAICGDEEMPPVGPLTMDPNLQCAARVHSKDMADRDFFDHDNPDGDGPSDRMDAAGYDGRNWGENIAAGRSTAAATMEQWMNSPGHCTNIMGEDFSLIGVGYYPGGEYGHVWTQTFGD